MSRHLFFVLLLMVLCCICGPAYAEGSVQPKSVELFVPGTTKVPFKENNKMTQKDVKYFDPLFLVSADGVMFAFARADYNGNDQRSYEKGNIDIAARYIENKAMDWVEKAMENNGGNWETQLVIQNEVQKDFFFSLENAMAIGKDNKIYLLAIKYNLSKTEAYPRDPNWDSVFTVGEVKTTNEGTVTPNKVEWKTSTSLNLKLIQKFKEQSLTVPANGGGGRYSFLTNDGKVVFILEAVKEGDKCASAIIHLNVTGEEVECELSHVVTTEGCDFPSFFEWEGKLIMVSYARNGGYKVKESVDMGRTWTDTVWPFSCLWYSLRDKGDFTTVTIETKKVLLLTERRIERTGSQEKHEIHLWMSDGKRVFDVGPIVGHTADVSSAGLLYVKDELFSLYQQWNEEDMFGKVILTRLNDELEKIKSVLKTWEAKDEFLSRPCSETTPQGTPCATPMPTDGLVGFLSNTTSGDNNNVWVDEYLYVNATVKGGTKVDNGFMFRGTNSGAQWPVGLQGQRQRYDFARYGLTVVATVTVHEVPKSDSPLLTIGGVSNEEPPGLWYGSYKQWKLRSIDGGVVLPEVEWEANKSYRVAVILQNNNVSAYVDGDQVGDCPLPISTSGEGLLSIGHFFIGGYKEEDSPGVTFGPVTVTNVFLYNRPFNAIELKALGEKRAGTPKPNVHPDGSPERKKQTETSFNPKKTGDSCVYMPVVTSLLCLLGLWGLAAFC